MNLNVNNKKLKDHHLCLTGLVKPIVESLKSKDIYLEIAHQSVRTNHVSQKYFSK